MCTLQRHVFRLLSASIRDSARSRSTSKFSFDGSKKSNKNYNVVTGVGYGIGIAMLFGINAINDHCELSSKILPNICTCYALSFTKDKAPSPRVAFNFLADVVEKTQKSVVYIEINARHPVHGGSIPISNGSGFIVKENGLILTSAHVVNHFGRIIIKLYDGQEYIGTVEALDTESDLATVRIKAKNLPVLPLGCSSDLRPGEFVIAIGNPLSLSHSITAGVISSTNRKGTELGLQTESSGYLQTDAAIHVGNSGGPLVNLDGQAIGINTMKITEGICFAIPSDQAIEFLKRSEEKANKDQKKTSKQSTASVEMKKFLGITMLTLSPEVIRELEERNPEFPSVDHGVLVWRVMVGSPSYESGIRPGDVITRVNGTKVIAASVIQETIEKEDVLRLTVQRGVQSFEVSVTLVEPVMP